MQNKQKNITCLHNVKLNPPLNVFFVCVNVSLGSKELSVFTLRKSKHFSFDFRVKGVSILLQQLSASLHNSVCVKSGICHALTHVIFA